MNFFQKILHTVLKYLGVASKNTAINPDLSSDHEKSPAKAQDSNHHLKDVQTQQREFESSQHPINQPPDKYEQRHKRTKPDNSHEKKSSD